MSLRIISGAFKGRVLKTPKGESTRPTLGRVRESLFSILGNIEAEAVLDLYAGSGALALEALSRGAQRAVLVEPAAPALAAIRANVAMLGVADRTCIIAQRAERAWRQLTPHAPFDLVFCDPPWAELEHVKSVLSELDAVLSERARLVVEHPAKVTLDPPPKGLILADRRGWGGTGISIFERMPVPAAGS